MNINGVNTNITQIMMWEWRTVILNAMKVTPIQRKNRLIIDRRIKDNFLLLSKKSTRYWAFATDPAYVYIDPQTSISHSIIHTHASQICRIFPSKLSDFPFFSERAFTLVIGGGQAGAGRRGLINPFLPPPLPLPLLLLLLPQLPQTASHPVILSWERGKQIWEIYERKLRGESHQPLRLLSRIDPASESAQHQ